MDEIKAIIEKYLAGAASPEEQLRLLHFLRGEKKNQLLFIKVKKAWEVKPGKSFTIKEWEAWSQIRASITAVPKNRISSIWPNVFKVASVIAALFIISLFIAIPVLKNQRVKVFSRSGQNINLLLPDSSSVILNSNSSIEYNPVAFVFSRKVELAGEAYFKVRRKGLKPFLVQAKDLQVQVLGTHFNVCAFEDAEKYEVVLEKGLVNVSLGASSLFTANLHPGEKAEIIKKTRVGKVSAVNTRLYTAWTEGVLYFYDSPFKKVVSRLEDRYGVKIVLSDSLIQDFVLSTTISDESFEEVLELLQKVLPVKASEKEGVIYFSLDKNQYHEFITRD